MTTATSASADTAYLPLEPILALRNEGKLDDARYEKKLLGAVKGHRVAPLWALGFALRKKPVGARPVRVRHEVTGVEMVPPQLVWSQHATTIIGVPITCSFGCCDYEERNQPVGAVRVSTACFANGELTDLHFVTNLSLAARPPVEEITPAEAIKQWLADSDRIALANALTHIENKSRQATDAAAIRATREATTRPSEVGAWRAASAFATTPAVTHPFTAILPSAARRATRTKVPNWAALLVLTTTPLHVGQPYVCIGACCRFARPADANAPAISDACFDDHDRLTRVSVDLGGDALELVDWIGRRVRADAKASEWSPATRLDACLPAAIAPTDPAAVLYCAQRFPPGKTRQSLWVYLDWLVRSVHSLPDAFDYSAYWLARARDPHDDVVRRASLEPLVKLADDGAVIWEDARRVGIAKTRADFVKRYNVPVSNDGGSRLYDPPSVLPTSCEGACCAYDLTKSTPCPAGGGPKSFVLWRACFDTTGATTDLYVYTETGDDETPYPDEP